MKLKVNYNFKKQLHEVSYTSDFIIITIVVVVIINNNNKNNYNSRTSYVFMSVRRSDRQLHCPAVLCTGSKAPAGDPWYFLADYIKTGFRFL